MGTVKKDPQSNSESVVENIKTDWTKQNGQTIGILSRVVDYCTNRTWFIQVSVLPRALLLAILFTTFSSLVCPNFPLAYNLDITEVDAWNSSFNKEFFSIVLQMVTYLWRGSVWAKHLLAIATRAPWDRLSSVLDNFWTFHAESEPNIIEILQLSQFRNSNPTHLIYREPKREWARLVVFLGNFPDH